MSAVAIFTVEMNEAGEFRLVASARGIKFRTFPEAEPECIEALRSWFWMVNAVEVRDDEDQT